LIYVTRDDAADVYQGDIYASVPFVHLSLSEPVFFTSPNAAPATWSSCVAAVANGDIIASVPLRASLAMVISQDCDAARDDSFVTLCEVDDFRRVHPDIGDRTSADQLQKQITKVSKIVLRWFYLPIDTDRPDLNRKNAADFRVTTRLTVRDLRTLHRVAGLNETAREHLRHRIAYFFQRYAVDEWYALDAAELRAYRRDGHPDTAAFEWQPEDE
jgi:hypothetical protein